MTDEGVEERLDDHKYSKLAKKAGDHKYRDRTGELINELESIRGRHFYELAESKTDGNLRDKSDKEFLKLINDYKIEDDNEAERLVDRFGVHVLHEVSGLQGKMYEDIVNKKNRGEELSKEEKDHLAFSRETLRLYGVNFHQLKHTGKEKGFTKEVLNEPFQNISRGTYHHQTSKHLSEIPESEQEDLAAHLVKAAKEKADLKFDENKVKRLSFEEMKEMLVEAHNEPKSLKNKYKHLIKPEEESQEEHHD